MNVSFKDKLEDRAVLSELIKSGNKRADDDNVTGEEDEEVEDDDEDEGNDPEKKIRKYLSDGTIICHFIEEFELTLLKDVLTDEKLWLEKLKKEIPHFTPPGKMLTSYTHDNETYEIWKVCSLICRKYFLF